LETLGFDTVKQILLYFQESKVAEEKLPYWEQIAIDYKHNERLIKSYKMSNSEFNSETYEKSVNRIKLILEQRKENFEQN
jgi:hypothetical protein